VPFRIQVLGPFRLTGPDGDVVSFRSNAKLLAVLAVRGSQPVSRRALVSALWPEVDVKTGNNRLRVALSKLRLVLPDALLETEEGLTLDPSAVETDFAEYTELLRSAGDTTSEDDEFEGLYRAFQRFTQGLASRPFEEWPISEIGEALEQFSTACTRAAELALKLNRDSQALEICSAALALAPIDASLWRVLLRARRNLGYRGEAAVRDIVATKDRTLLGNHDIRSLIDQIVKGAPTGYALLDESRLSHAIVETLIEKRPELAHAVLSSPETLSLAGSNPRLMLSLLERAVASPSERDSHWERCVARVCGLKAWLGDAQGVFDYGLDLVQRSKNPVILRAVWNAIGVAHSLRWDWPQAMDAVETTIGYAKELDSEIDVLSAEGNRANYLWQQAQFESSLKEYERILSRVKQIGTPQAQFEYVIGFGNRAFIPVMQADWSTALAWITESAGMREGSGAVPMGLLLPAWALAKVASGQPNGAFGMIREAFLNASDQDSARSRQITFEFAACTLGFTEHKSFGHSVIDWVDGWRRSTCLPRCAAEIHLIESIFGRNASAAPIDSNEPPSKVGSELLKRLRYSLRTA
jgi:DNA-binding SARP family transcriptional activator